MQTLKIIACLVLAHRGGVNGSVRTSLAIDHRLDVIPISGVI
jgi:hypothetical protein